jgi:DNA helicase-2/ATP-dependent DNA helicase PcrA
VSAHLEAGANAEQLQIIRHTTGPLLAPAVAGCGKTFAAVRRVGMLVANGVDPDRIVMLTFSRKAADEMDARVRHLGISGVSCQTWHGLCGRILKEDGHPASKWLVDDKDKAKGHVKAAIGYKHMNWVGADTARIRKFIAHCKAQAWEYDDPGAQALAKKRFGHEAQKAIEAWLRSQELIEAAGLLTFDDMLVFAYRHLAGDEGVRAAWAARFDYVVVDEYQDNSRVQDEIMEMLSRHEVRNLMAVGDPAQSIYSFRGSSPSFILGFEARFGAARIAMNRNYRSGRAIVAAANTIIRAGTVRLPEEMIAERDAEGQVDVVPCDTMDDEAAEFVDFARRWQEDGKKLSEICALFRLNAQSRALEDALLKAKLPYVLVGGTNFYERKEVKDLLGYLRVAFDRDKDGDAVRRCINAPFRFLGAKFVERVMGLAGEGGGWASIVATAATQAGLQRRQVQGASEWVQLITELAAMDGGPYELLDHVVRKTEYIKALEKEEGAEDSVDQSHGANVRELLRVSQSFKTVGELLDYVDANILESSRQKRGRRENSLTLMSIHRSKGLEWPAVWVVGCNEMVFPHPKSDVEEERRLMYVAATRARDHLVFSHVAEMATRAGIKSVDRSRFLDGVVREPAPDFPFVDPSAAEELVGEVVETPALEARNPGSGETFGGLAWLGEGHCLECSEVLTHCRCSPDQVKASDRA